MQAINLEVIIVMEPQDSFARSVVQVDRCATQSRPSWRFIAHSECDPKVLSRSRLSNGVVSTGCRVHISLAREKGRSYKPIDCFLKGTAGLAPRQGTILALSHDTSTTILSSCANIKLARSKSCKKSNLLLMFALPLDPPCPQV